MHRHASMNRIYRLIWNEALNAFMPAAETARGRGKSSKRKLIAAALSLSATMAQAGPTGGQVTGGNGTITPAGATTIIRQSSQNLSLDWQTFNVAPQETVEFVQPNSSAVAVNRILDPNGSVILGHLDANGQVYLINPNGVIFGKGAEIDVGGLVASTLDFSPSSAGNVKTFSGSGSGSILNAGTITAADGGTVALLGNHVANTGTIGAQLGSVALGAGSAVTLTFSGTRLVSMQVDQSVLNSVASNGGLIRADGGQVLMTAGAQKSLLASVVNNTGVIEARTLENHEGTITLSGGMAAGTVNVGGTLDASAPNGGSGGFIETSAEHVEVAGSAKVTTAAAMGLNGTWLIDPTDFTISAGTASQTASGIGATTLQNELAGGNVSFATIASGSQNGDINVNAPVSWSSNMLTLTAANNINVNAVMTVSGTAKADFEPGVSGNLLMGFAPDGTFAGRVDISSSAPNALTIGGNVYTVITRVGSAGDVTSAPATATLQGMAAPANLNGYFALGSNIDAGGTSSWNGAAGFTPIGTAFSNFNGMMDGLGHTIANLHTNQPANVETGLFGFLGFGSAVRNLGIVGGSVAGGTFVGALAGFSYGAIFNSFATADVTGAPSGQYVGGLVGSSASIVSNSHATGTVSAGTSTDVGGLIGDATTIVTHSYATGTVTGGNSIGGLVGACTYNCAISNSYYTGPSVNGGSLVGGLVGHNYGQNTITRSYANTAVSGADHVGGLVGANYGTVNTSHASSAVNGVNDVGGLVGSNANGTVSNSYASGNVVGAGLKVGGLVGESTSQATISNTFASGSVTATGNFAGGLVGWNYGTINNSYAIGRVSGADYVGGLVGQHAGIISNTYALGVVTGTGLRVGGLAGANYGIVSNSFYSSTANPTLTGFGFYSAADSAGTVVGMTPAQFLTQANFTSATTANGSVSPGWDFGSTWTMYEGHTTPLLQVFMTPLTVTGTITQTYNGAVFAPTIGNLDYSVTPDLGHLFGTVTVTGSAVGALHAGAYTFTPGGLYSDQLGYMISYSAGSLTIVPARLTVAGSTASKVYDGTTAVVLTGGSLVGVIGGDTITLTQAGSFASKNAGTGIAVSVSDSIGGASAGDYTLVEPTGVTGTITPAALTVSGTTVGSKTYNGTTAADLAGGSLVGVIGGDTVTLTQAGSFASKNVGTGIAVTANDSLGGTDASNYTIVEPTGLTGSVTPATLTVSGTAVGNKTYNGSNVAPLTGGTLVGVVSGDSVTLNQSGTFASIGVGSGIAVTATDALSGADAGDYRLTEPTGLTGSILPAPSAGRANGPNVSVLAAQNAETQIVENLLYPQLGARPQVIDALPTIQAMAGSAADVNASASAETATQQAIAVNVSMKIGATGTLKIENGGLRLPGNLVIGNE